MKLLLRNYGLLKTTQCIPKRPIEKDNIFRTKHIRWMQYINYQILYVLP